MMLLALFLAATSPIFLQMYESDDIAVSVMRNIETCPADALQIFVGRAYDSVAIDPMPEPLRILPEGAMMTMDFFARRTNIQLDGNRIIVRIWCG